MTRELSPKEALERMESGASTFVLTAVKDIVLTQAKMFPESPPILRFFEDDTGAITVKMDEQFRKVLNQLREKGRLQ